MKNHTRNLQIGFGLSLLLLVISSAASYVSIDNLVRSSQMVTHTNAVIRGLDEVISIMKDAETGQRGYLLTQDTSFLNPYNGSRIKIASSLHRVRALVADNPKKAQRIDHLKSYINTRFNSLEKVIADKKLNKQLQIDDLNTGRASMNKIRTLVQQMQQLEDQELKPRTKKLNALSDYTPIIIVFAALLAILITVLFYIKLNSDFKQRILLQQELLQKDEAITKRIDIIQNLAEKISSGNYSIRIDEEEKDGLGILAMSLDKMAQSLEQSFMLLSDKEWLQAGVAGLNEQMVGEKDIPELAYSVIKYLADYTDSQTGAIYLLEEQTLRLAGSFSLDHRKKRNILNIGEGLMGQSVLSGKEMILNITTSDHYITFATGEVKLQHILAFPIPFENRIIGGVELAGLTEYTDVSRAFFKNAAENIGIAINVAQNRNRLEELLGETQAQTEELQVQHSELENLNSELEMHAERLQASEEELKVQQEELMHANQELEERSGLLEEKNNVILERNQEILRKVEELAISTKYKSEFLANMSHELRTPLNSILLLSRLMAENHENTLTEDQVEYAKVIQSSGNGLLELINEILDLSKIEAGKMTLEYEDVEIVDIVSQLRRLFAPLAKEKNLELIISVDADVSLSIETDKMRLEQILKNLLSNALKFTAQGQVTLNVLNADQGGNFLIFSVTDTGMGIPENKQQLIFEAFQQADGSTKRKYGGTGLGLSISRELVKLLGGQITLKSTVGKGSEFILTVPVKKIDIVLEKVILPLGEKRKIAYKEPEIHRLPERLSYVVPLTPQNIADDREEISSEDKVILIVEDDIVFAKSLLTFTRKKGYKGVVALRGDEGIVLAQQFLPSAILLDIQLPVKDGWEVMEDLKSNPHTRHIPVHIMSSLEVKRESLLKGAVDFINKPFALEQMQDIFRKLEDALTRHPKKVLIVEENPQHAKALAYFLEGANIYSEIRSSVTDGMQALKKDDVDCVIIDMGLPNASGYETLEVVKKNPGWENLPIIIFTGKNLSKTEEQHIRQYADSIVVKTAHSYQRILDEVTLFLHIVETQTSKGVKINFKKQLDLHEVLNKKTVLIADDDVRNIFSLTKALELHKMNIISAIDGKEALRQLELNPEVDIVLMDMMMPEMDGYETTMRIRKMPEYKKLPILAVTAKAMMGDRDKCIQAGASDYISKPVDIDQLISLLRVWLYDKSM
ncbi:MAG: response regulator [Sphingobacteriaceae bacterium]